MSIEESSEPSKVESTEESGSKYVLEFALGGVLVVAITALIVVCLSYRRNRAPTAVVEPDIVKE